MTTPPTNPTPTRLGGFDIVRRLGSGGMAEVFVAKKTGAESIVKVLVVKRILGGQDRRRFRAMFIDEAQLATRLNHPNIVQVYDFQDAGEDGLLLAMEYVEGTDLAQLASRAREKGTRIPPWVSAYIVAEAARGLHYAHERKEGGVPLEIVHRDVSPQNVLLSHEGAVKIADFGIASANLFLDEVGILKGKYGYMSPEQARGEKVDRRSDIYSLGVIFHELLTGRPLHGPLVHEDLLEAVRAGIVEPPSTFTRGVPPELETIVMRALSRDKEDRFQTARDFASAILRAQLERQQLVDASAVEATIAQLIGRDGPASVGSIVHARSTTSASSSPPSPPLPSVRGRRMARETRHVVIVSLRLVGLDELDLVLGRQASAKVAERVKRTLDDIAYKHGARFTWEARDVARAMVGLLANPARAASDATRLSLDVHEALASAYEDLAAPIRAAISMVRAIAKGERDEEGHLVHHELQAPAETIATLVSERTPFGTTWATGGLYRQTRREFLWKDAKTLDLSAHAGEAMPASIRLYALERARSREERHAELALLPSELIGREAEKADLFAAYYAAVQGPGSIVARVVTGEMGIGKTALVSAFLSELPPEARVVRIECTPARAHVPDGGIADLVREMTETKADQPIDEVVAKVRELIEPLARGRSHMLALALSELIAEKQLREAEDEEAHDRRRLIREGVRALIASVAKRGPIVIVIDGLQWTHRSGLELIARLLESRAKLPVLTLLLTRPDDRARPFLEGLVRIELSGLSPEEQIYLVESRFGVQQGVRELCADLVAKVAGNPFFLLEMVDALLERGAFEIREGEDGKQKLVRVERPGEKEEPLPSTLEQLIDDRLRELPEKELAVVEWLALAEGPLTEAELRSLSKRDDLGAPLARLLERGICERKEGGVYDLRQPLIREVAYRTMNEGSRARMHARMAEHLVAKGRAEGLSAAVVAEHFARGNAKGRAAELYLEAGTTARSALRSRQAIRFFQRALALLPEGDARRLSAHEALEAIYRVLGQRRPRMRHLQALRRLARRIGRPKWVAIALLRTARQCLDDGFLSAGVPQAERAEHVAKLARSPLLEAQAQVLLSELLRELGHIEKALAACERALETARHSEVGARFLGEALRTRGVLLRRVGRVNEAVRCHAEAIAIFRKTGAKRQEARAKNSLSYAMFVLGRYEDAIALALDSIRIDLSIGGRFQLAKTISNIGYAYARLGDTKRALAYLEKARELHERYGDQDSRADTLLVSAEVLIEQGDLDAAHVFCADASALTSVTNNAYDFVHERVVRALLARAGGEHEAAVRYAERARREAEGRGLVSFLLFATAIEAASRVDSGDVRTGESLATYALGAALEMEGTEFGLEVHALCAEALERAGSSEARKARKLAASHARRIVSMTRDARLRRLFRSRPLVVRLLGEDDETGGSRGADA